MPEISALFIIVSLYVMLKETIKNEETKKIKPMHGWSFDVAHGLKRFMTES